MLRRWRLDPQSVLGRNSSTRSTGTPARCLASSNDSWAARAASANVEIPAGTVIGTRLANQPTVIVSMPGIRVSYGMNPWYVAVPVNSWSAIAAHAKTPPLNRHRPRCKRCRKRRSGSVQQVDRQEIALSLVRRHRLETGIRRVALSVPHEFDPALIPGEDRVKLITFRAAAPRNCGSLRPPEARGFIHGFDRSWYIRWMSKKIRPADIPSMCRWSTLA